MARTRKATDRRRTTGLAGAAAAAALVLGACSSGPAADAGDDFTVGLGEAPVFDGCDSSGGDLSYTWTIVEAPADMSDDVGKVLRQSIGDCSFTLESDMEVADVGVWTIELMVTDGVAEETDQVTVTVVDA